MADSYADEVLSWAEAEAAFKARLSMSAAEFYALREGLRGQAWTVKRIAEHAVMLRAKHKLQTIIETGGLLSDFAQWVESESLAFTRAYSELVFRMAVFSSYSRGRYEEANSPGVVEEFEWLVYDAVDDGRTRDEHAAMDGRAWRRDEFPDEWWPPNGFNCRCEVRVMNDQLLERSGANVQSGRPGEAPDEGFRANQNLRYDEMLSADLRSIQTELTN